MASPEFYQQEGKGEGIWRFLALGVAAVVLLDVLIDDAGKFFNNTGEFIGSIAPA